MGSIAAPPHAPSDGSYYDLGTYERPVSTSSPEAKTWFDRGLRWIFGFNHEAAVECFDVAITHDRDFALAHWGIAYCLGPNYNKPWAAFPAKELIPALERIRSEVQKAKDAAANASAVEKALVDAIQYRYQADKLPDDSSPWHTDYANAMEKVYAAHGDDLDVVFLYTDALMNLTPWNLWDIRTGKVKEGARTLEARQALDKALAMPGANTHAGLLHLYIHLMEMSSAPEEALPLGNLLRGLIPDGGHLQHMTTHLDLLCGDYAKAVEWNTKALAADDKYIKFAGTNNFYSLYRSHNYHSLIYAAMFSGQYKMAMETFDSMEETMPESLLRIEIPPMADWVESAITFRYHILVRFGRWKEIIDHPLPHDQELYAATTAIAHYAKGVAHAALGQVNEAEQEREHFKAACDRMPASRMLFNYSCKDLNAIAGAMLDGEIEYRKGNFDAAFQHLRRAIELDDGLPYGEPWGWMQPTRHAYGALLLEQGHVEEAATVYRADLGFDKTLPRALQHPNNLWALHGYHECLLKLGKTDEAALINKELQEKQKAADQPIKSSCFCRMDN